MKSNLLETKLLIPPVRPIWVSRPHLVELLNAGLDRKLILVSAPAGYGKSTLLSEWVDQLPLPVAWLSLEKGDNTPSRFWAYFTAAVQTLPAFRNVHIGETLMELENIAPTSSQQDALTELIAEISATPERFILVLDDLHLITDPKIHEGLTFLLEHLPPPPGGMHLVIASRMDPPWPLARMRARAETAEIRTKDLRFGTEEATIFLNRVMGLKISAGDVLKLEQRTEGWIAGLQMAALSMKNRNDIPEFLERFSGSHRYVLDYLIEEVLNQQTPEVMDFLLKTSILDRLTAPLCDSVTGGEDSQDILMQLEKSNVFLFSLDDEQCWYRYHPLFADLLRKRLSIRHSAQIPDLHVRASEWYEAHGFLRDSILHALEADDMKQVARLVSGNILVLAEGQALPELLDHIHTLSAEDIRSRPWLCISVAWVKAYAGHLEEAESLIDELETTLSETVSESERAHISGHGMTIRAYAQYIKGHATQAMDISYQALAEIPAEDALEKVNILIILGLALQNSGDFFGAIKAFQDAIAMSREFGNLFLLIYASSCLAFVYKASGQLHQSLKVCEETIRVSENNQMAGSGYYISAIGYATKSEVLWERHDLNGALEAAQQAVALAEQWRQVDALHYSLTCLVDAYLALGDINAARSAMEKSKWIASKVSDWFMEISEIKEVEINLACGNLDQVMQWKQRVSKGEPKYLTHYLLVARFMFTQKHYSEALDLLDDGFHKFESSGFWAVLIQMLLIKALAHSALGQTDEALSALQSALDRAEPEGYVTILVRLGKPMSRLLSMAVRRGIHKEYSQHLLDIIAAGRPQTGEVGSPDRSKQPAVSAEMPESLSERELEVLRLLNTKLSVPEIAQELTVASSTVRTHVHNIYSKLEVHGRIEAIQRAKELELI